MSAYEELLKELGVKMGLNLKPDTHMSCLLDINAAGTHLKIQIDLTGDADKLLIGTFLGSVNPGSYRHELFRRALETNGCAGPLKGTFAFCTKNDMLVLFQFMPLQTMSADYLYDFLLVFLEHAKVWVHAIGQGALPPLTTNVPTGSRYLGL